MLVKRRNGPFKGIRRLAKARARDYGRHVFLEPEVCAHAMLARPSQPGKRRQDAEGATIHRYLCGSARARRSQSALQRVALRPSSRHSKKVMSRFDFSGQVRTGERNLAKAVQPPFDNSHSQENEDARCPSA